jgi:hypothetical protein
VKYHLPLAREHEETARRVLEIHPVACPAHESVKESIRFKIDADFDMH